MKRWHLGLALTALAFGAAMVQTTKQAPHICLCGSWPTPTFLSGMGWSNLPMGGPMGMPLGFGGMGDTPLTHDDREA